MREGSRTADGVNDGETVCREFWNYVTRKRIKHTMDDYYLHVIWICAERSYIWLQTVQLRCDHISYHSPKGLLMNSRVFTIYACMYFHNLSLQWQKHVCAFTCQSWITNTMNCSTKMCLNSGAARLVDHFIQIVGHLKSIARQCKKSFTPTASNPLEPPSLQTWILPGHIINPNDRFQVVRFHHDDVNWFTALWRLGGGWGGWAGLGTGYCAHGGCCGCRAVKWSWLPPDRPFFSAFAQIDI